MKNLLPHGTVIKFFPNADPTQQQLTGIIVGVASTELPVIGVSYIVKVSKTDHFEFKKNGYDYPCVCVFSCHILEKTL